MNEPAAAQALKTIPAVGPRANRRQPLFDYLPPTDCWWWMSPWRHHPADRRMYRGYSGAQRDVLVEYGSPSALDNRPLKFEEFQLP